MAYCRNCGSSAGNDVRFCPYCGQAMRNPVRDNGVGSSDFFANSNAERERRQRVNRASSRDGWYYRDDGFDPRDVEDNRYIAALCYLNLLLLIPLLLKPNSAYIRYHCNQGLLLTIFTMLVSVISKLPLIGWLAGALGAVFALICFVRGILNAISGNVQRLPVIGVFSIIT